MALIIKKLYGLYMKAMEEGRDRRVDDWFLMGSSASIATVLGCYLFFVLHLGPKLMKHRPPFNIDRILIVYNIFQVIYCLYIIFMACVHLFPVYSFTCEPIDYTNDPHAVLVLEHVWSYFFLKVIDLLDTIFFVLRKKDAQISFLHVYHHAGMVLVSWVGVKFVGGGSGVFIGVINCVVHAFMYTYYLLTVWNKSYKDSVWWKKHITHLQLVQFGMVFVLFLGLLLQKDCGYPKWVTVLMIPQNLFMFSLFGDFYYRTYVKTKKK